jgi:predicted HTH transcriptional regulator
MFIVQETTSGEIRGGTTLPYAVDVNMKISKDVDDKDFRIFDVYKNRFGPTMSYGARFGQAGYEFMGEYTESESEKEENSKKTPVKEIRKDTILNMDEPPLITLSRVMETLNIQEQTAKLLLSELEMDMKIIKYGRGKDAVWKFHNK